MNFALPAAIGAGLYGALQAANGAYFSGAIHAAWCGCFSLLHQGRVRQAAILAMTLAVLPRLILAAGARAILPGLLAGAWAAFLMVLARGGSSFWLARLTWPLTLLTAWAAVQDLLTVLATFNELLNGSLALFWRYNAARTLWRHAVTPAVFLVYWLTQMRFLSEVRRSDNG